MFRKTAISALLSLCAAVAFAQGGGTTSLLHVYLRDPHCDAVTGVTAVLQDRDREVITNAVAQPDRCHWIIDTKPIQFRSDRTHFSLRLRGLRGRTTCRIPAWNDTGFAQVEFGFLASVRKITVVPLPRMDLPYVREMPRREPADLACREIGILGGGSEPWTIDEVSVDHERIRLSRFETKNDACGLIVTSVRGMENAAVKDKGEMSLSRDLISDALRRQRNAQLQCHAPTLSGTAGRISEYNLDRRELTNLTIGWK